MSVSFPVSFSSIPCTVYNGQHIPVKLLADMLGTNQANIHNIVPKDKIVQTTYQDCPYQTFVTLDWLQFILTRFWYDNQEKAKQAVDEIRAKLAPASLSEQEQQQPSYWQTFEQQIVYLATNDNAVFDMMKTDEFKAVIQARINNSVAEHVLDEAAIRLEHLAQVEKDLRWQVRQDVERDIAKKRSEIENTPLTLKDL